MADPDHERLKQAHDQNLRSFWGSELGCNMGIFYQITLKYLIFGAELNRSVLRGFLDGETGNRSPIRGYFIAGRVWILIGSGGYCSRVSRDGDWSRNSP